MSWPVLTHVPPIHSPHSPPHLLQIQIGMPTNEKVKKPFGVSSWEQVPTYGSKIPLLTMWELRNKNLPF